MINPDLYPWPEVLICILADRLGLDAERAESRMNAFADFCLMPPDYQAALPEVARHICTGAEALPGEQLEGDVRDVILVAEQLSNLKSSDFKQNLNEDEQRLINSWFVLEGADRSALRELDSRGHPMRGKGMTKYPLYTCLVNYHESNVLAPYYAAIQFQVARAVYVYRRANDGYLLDGAQKHIVDVCKVIRAASLGANSSWLEHIKPSALMSGDWESCYRGVAPREPVDKPGMIIKFCCALRGQDLYRYVAGRGFRQRVVSSHKYVIYDGNFLPQVTSYIDDSVDSEDGVLDECVIFDHQKKQELVKKDVNPKEVRGKELISVVNSPQGHTGYFLSKRQAVYVEMANQNFGFDEKSYSSAEMALIMVVVAKRLDAVSISTIKNIGDLRDLQLSVICMLQVWLGFTFAESKTLFMSSSGRLNTKNTIQLTRRDGVNGWLKLVPKPKIKNYILFHPEICRPSTQELFLPDVFNISKYYMKLLSFCDGDTVIYPFEGVKKEEYLMYLQDVELDILSNYRKEIKLSEFKLSRFLEDSIKSCRGDSVECAYLTGRSTQPFDTQLYYFMPSMSHLSDIYERSVSKRLKEIYAEGYSKPKQFKSPDVDKSGSVGLGNCPTVAAVKGISLSLIAAFKDSSKSYFERHNLYAAYVALLVSYSTGIRAIKNPLPRKDWTENHKGFVLVSDKDGLATKDKVEIYSNTRIIPKIETLNRQLKLWDSYQIRLIKRVDGISKDVDISDAPSRQLLIFSEEGSVLEVASPSVLEKILMPYCKLKFNSNRRFLRTELRERGLDYEYVDAFMSHSHRGQEPWGRYSSFSPGEYSSSICSEVERLLIECNFSAQQAPFKFGVLSE